MVEACHNMACRCHGAANDYLCLHAQTHHSMKYYVRHKYGVLEDYNTFDQHPWHGAGQGTTDAAIWYIALSDLLIDAYHLNIQPRIIQDPMLTLVIVKSMKAFIDDIAMLVIAATGTLEQMTMSPNPTTMVDTAGSRIRWSPEPTKILLCSILLEARHLRYSSSHHHRP